MIHHDPPSYFHTKNLRTSAVDTNPAFLSAQKW